MNIVAIDTSTEACSVALLCGDSSASRYTVEPRAHARLLLPMLDELMAEAQITPLQLDGVAFARGPGAFTGVRIATAAAQAIALAADIPALPVSTLAAIACGVFRHHNHELAAVAIDARMGEVYWGAYRRAQQEGTVEPQLVDCELVCQPGSVPRLGAQGIAAGTGWEVYRTALTEASGASIIEGVEPFPHAENILAIGVEIFVQNRGVLPEHALPVYLRDNVARTEAERAANP